MIEEIGYWRRIMTLSIVYCLLTLLRWVVGLEIGRQRLLLMFVSRFRVALRVLKKPRSQE